MDRLTVWDHNDRGGKWSYHMDASVNDLCAKLAAYEDTGLTPDEIAALRTENADLRRRLEQRDATQYTHFCPECMERQAEVERLRTAMRKINDLAIGFMEGDGDPKEAFAIASAIYDASDAPRKGETDGEHREMTRQELIAENNRLRAENAAFKADIKAGRLVYCPDDWVQVSATQNKEEIMVNEQCKNPYQNGVCDRCSGRFELDGEDRCGRIMIGRSCVMCAQVSLCTKMDTKEEAPHD